MKKTPLFIKTKWNIDPSHSQISFMVKHPEFSDVRGRFTEFDASIYTNGSDFMTAQIDFWLNPASVDTGISRRDLLVKSAGFLHAERFKVINFRAGHYVKKESEGRYEIHGDLTMKDITKAIKLDVECSGLFKDTFGNERSIFHAIGLINRKDWGMNGDAGPDCGVVKLSEEVWIECDIGLLKQV